MGFAACITALAPPREADELLARGQQHAVAEGAKTALPNLERALSLYREAHNRRGEAIALGSVGRCYQELDEFPKCALSTRH